MRNKFSELVNAGVASFHHEPIAPLIPNSPGLTKQAAYMSRLYNMYWGAATDSHMDLSQDGRLLIKGRITQDEVKWFELMYGTWWGGINWKQSGYFTLGEFLSQNGMCTVRTVHNGEVGMEVVPCEDCPCQCACPAAVTTTESKIPQPIKVLGDVNEIKEAFENAHSMKQLVENLNDSKWIAGKRWFACENNVACTFDTPRGAITYIMEVNHNNLSFIEDEEFAKLMKEEGLEALKLVQFNGYFSLYSDDKKWAALLNKWKDNKIKEKSFDAMTPREWVDQIKYMLSVFN